MVPSHACLKVKESGTDENPYEKYDTYTYALEGVALKDGLLVGTITIIVSALVSLGKLTCKEAGTIGETIPRG